MLGGGLVLLEEIRSVGQVGLGLPGVLLGREALPLDEELGDSALDLVLDDAFDFVLFHLGLGGLGPSTRLGFSSLLGSLCLRMKVVKDEKPLFGRREVYARTALT